MYAACPGTVISEEQDDPRKGLLRSAILTPVLVVLPPDHPTFRVGG